MHTAQAPASCGPQVDASLRATAHGHTVRLVPWAQVSELCPPSVGALLKQRMRWAMGWEQVAGRRLCGGAGRGRGLCGCGGAWWRAEGGGADEDSAASSSAWSSPPRKPPPAEPPPEPRRCRAAMLLLARYWSLVAAVVLLGAVALTLAAPLALGRSAPLAPPVAAVGRLALAASLLFPLCLVLALAIQSEPWWRWCHVLLVFLPLAPLRLSWSLALLLCAWARLCLCGSTPWLPTTRPPPAAAPAGEAEEWTVEWAR